MADEIGWIIVKYVHSNIMYWTGDAEDFTSDNSRAIRFARQTDAERMLTWHLGGNGKVEEHMWIDKKMGDAATRDHVKTPYPEPNEYITDLEWKMLRDIGRKVAKLSPILASDIELWAYRNDSRKTGDSPATSCKSCEYERQEKYELMEHLRQNNIGLNIAEAHHEVHHAKEEVLQARCEALVEALQKSADVFKSYYELHMEKSPPDLVKAEKNLRLATECKLALATHRKSVGENG